MRGTTTVPLVRPRTIAGLSRSPPEKAVAKRFWTMAALLPSPGCFECDSKDAPQAGSNGFSIGVGQCAEPLRVSCIYRCDLRGAQDRWGGEAGGAEIRYTHIVRPAPILGTGDHDEP
jgi:hypothetical protein